MKRFIELIHIAIGKKECFDTVPTAEEWKSLVVHDSTACGEK